MHLTNLHKLLITLPNTEQKKIRQKPGASQKSSIEVDSKPAHPYLGPPFGYSTFTMYHGISMIKVLRMTPINVVSASAPMTVLFCFLSFVFLLCSVINGGSFYTCAYAYWQSPFEK